MANNAVRFHPQAESEYLQALNWYRVRSATAAANFEEAISRAIATVESFPDRWPVYFQYFRKYTLHSFPFSIIYRQFASEIVVFAIAHGSRKPGYWKSRR